LNEELLLLFALLADGAHVCANNRYSLFGFRWLSWRSTTILLPKVFAQQVPENVKRSKRHIFNINKLTVVKALPFSYIHCL